MSLAMLTSSPQAAAPVLLMARLAQLMVVPRVAHLVKPMEKQMGLMWVLRSLELLETWFFVEVLPPAARAHLLLVSILHFKIVQLGVQALAVVAPTLQGAEMPNPSLISPISKERLLTVVRLVRQMVEGPAVHHTCLEKLVGLVWEQRKAAPLVEAEVYLPVWGMLHPCAGGHSLDSP
jgi:hypothetical protein